MVTPALIDLNILALKELDKAYYYLSQQDYDMCTASLHAVNAAMPPEYHINFNTKLYKQQTEHPVKIYCKYCETCYDRDEIKIWDMLLPLAMQIGTINKTIKAWTCRGYKKMVLDKDGKEAEEVAEGCKKDNILTQSRVEKTVVQEPFFLKLVPNPPERKQNLADRTTFYIRYKSWFGMVVSELVRQISQLRWDNHQSETNASVDSMTNEVMTALESKYA